jgi:hypothetical protein
MEEECVTPHTTEEYREIELFETKLRVYPNGNMMRLIKVTNQFGKKGEWKLVNVKPDNGYLRFKIKGKMVRCHRIVGYAYLGLDIDDLSREIDHINRIRNDNRVDNLQIVTNQQNMFNTGAKGYSFVKSRNKYRAEIMLNGKKIYLGYYDTEEEAATAYQTAKLIHHII